MAKKSASTAKKIPPKNVSFGIFDDLYKPDIQKKNAHLASFPELNINPLVELNQEGRVIYANRAMLEISPDIIAKGTSHKLLAGIDLKKTEGMTKREVFAGGRWYMQTIMFIPDLESIRVYGVDITDRVMTEKALAASEKKVKQKLENILTPEGDLSQLDLADVLDADVIQSLMDDFHKLIPFPLAVLDLKGNVLAGVGWQDICTKFHRVNPQTCKHCIESDTQLTKGIPPGEFRLYKCKNGMWDVATPIMVGGRHMGNLFSGQFFFKDENPDHNFFKMQALKHDFKLEEYMAALDAVPTFERKTMENGLSFLLKIADMISKLSYSNIKLARSLSERGQLVDSLQESEAKLKRSQEIAHLGSWELDLKKNELSWSDEVYRIFGLKPQEFAATYEAFLAHVHPEDRRAVDEAYAGSIKKKKDAYEIEHRVVQKWSGEIRWVHEKCYHIRDAKGNIIRSIGMVLDITGRKNREAQIKAQQEIFETTVNELPAGVGLYKGSDFIVEIVNPAYLKISSGRGKIIGRTYREVWPEVYPAVEPLLKKVLETGEPHQAIDEKFLLQDKEGKLQPRYFTWSLIRIKLPGEKNWGILNTVIETTARKIAEEKLIESERKFFAVFQKSPYGIVLLNAEDGSIVDFNEAFYNIFGYSKKEAVGKRPVDLGLHDESVRQILSSELHDSGSVRAAEVSLRTKSGETRIFSNNSEYVQIAGVKHILATLEDITERKKLENQKDEFIGIASHELKTPLSTIKGYAQLLDKVTPVQDTRAKQYIKKTNHYIEELNQLVTELLDVTQLRAGGIRFYHESYDFNLVLNKAIESMRINLVRHNITKRGLVKKRLYGDPIRTEQVVTNLLSNAVKYSPKGGTIKITVSEKNDGIRVSVKDPGMGIPEKKIDEIFGRFYRVNEAAKHSSGWGIGLYIAKEYVERQGGTIWAKSKLGEGSTFSFWMPYKAKEN